MRKISPQRVGPCQTDPAWNLLLAYHSPVANKKRILHAGFWTFFQQRFFSDFHFAVLAQGSTSQHARLSVASTCAMERGQNHGASWTGMRTNSYVIFDQLSPFRILRCLYIVFVPVMLLRGLIAIILFSRGRSRIVIEKFYVALIPYICVFFCGCKAFSGGQTGLSLIHI